MVKKALVFLILIVIVLVVAGFMILKNPGQIEQVKQEEQSQIYDVEIKDFAFTPQTLTIKIDETVTWANKDSAKHTVTSDIGNELDFELSSKGKTYSHTFNEKGTFNYHCTYHQYMEGKIIVE